MYPQHEKLKDRKEEHQTVSAFLEWLADEGHSITHQVEYFDGDRRRCIDRYSRPQDLIAGYFGIDQRAFSLEKDQMIQDFMNNQD